MARSTIFTTEKIGPKQSLTPEGFLLCEEVPLARTGMMIYGPDETPISAGADGITRIFRTEEEAFRAETIASALGKSVTNDHPEDDVRPESWKDLSHGIMLNVRRGVGAMDDLLIGDLLVTTPEGIEAVQSGKREVSLGYDADYTETTPGVGFQSNIIINHIALVEQGRCGPRCAISDHKPANLKGPEMTTAKTKSNRVLDMLMKAFKAKDAAEVEQLAAEAKDDLGVTDPLAGSETHIHLHTGGATTGAQDDGVIVDPALGKPAPGDAGNEELAALIAQNQQEHDEFRSRLEALEAALAKAAPAAGAGTGDEENDLPKEALDELPEALRENASKAKDSAYLGDTFKDSIALAEILVPGIRVPTFDAAARPGLSYKRLCGFRRQALDLAYSNPATRMTMDDVLAGKGLDTKTMTCDAVRVLFTQAANAQRIVNNAAANAGRARDEKGSAKGGPVTLAEINRRNQERYKS